MVRGGIFIIAGGGLAAVAALRVHRLIVLGTSRGRGRVDVFSTLHGYRRRGQGPRIVAIGGGTGLPTVLRGLKYRTDNLTAIVTVADDGGSSGRLRQELGMPPPGDARNCMGALSWNEPLMEDLFNYRFNGATDLDGHSLGNLLLAALCDIQGGFQPALESARELLSISGRVVPVTEQENLVLTAETLGNTSVIGESAIGHAGEPLRRVGISPQGALISEAAVEAIAFADLIVFGPGSLYTSIIPNVLVKGMPEALAACPAPRVFVCNVATESDETNGYGVAEYLHGFQDHAGVEVTHLLVNTNVESLPLEWGQQAVLPQDQVQGFKGQVILADVVDESFRTRHDSAKLAGALLAILGGEY